jgi:threonine dehydratase
MARMVPLSPSPIATERLLLAPVSEDQAAAVVSGDASAVRAGEGWPHDGTLRGLRMALCSGHAPGWFVTLSGVVIGDCGIHGEPDENGDIELGYGLAEPYRGQGYGTEVAAGLSRWLLAQEGVRRVVGRAALDNPPGRRTLERARFTLASVGEEYARYVLVDRVRLRMDRIRAAVAEIDPTFLDTPTLPCTPLGRALGCSITLKVETVNPVRSFKGRGTETAAAAAAQRGASRLVCASAGNLGQALAYSGGRRGLEVTVVAARTANPLKLRQIAAFGAEVRLEGEDIEDARLLARGLAEAGGAYLVEDSLDLATCEGAATIGLELVRDDPQVDVILVAIGGGAMASGVGYVMRSLADHVEVIGIQPRGAPAMALSWRQREVVETDRIDTIADGVAGRCPIPEVLDDLLVVLDDVALVGEESIKAGMRLLYEHAGLVVEPSAALGVAAVLEQPARFAGRRVTTILCGSNVAPADFARWVLEPAAG